MIGKRQTICQSEKLASIFINKARIRNIFLTLDSRANRLHDGFQGFHAADKRTGPCYSGLVHHELAWKHLGYTRRQRETEALMLIVNAFVPLATYNWLFPAETQFSFPMQILLYCSMQVVWIVSIEIAPDWVGRIRQRKAEERALSGKQHFESREEVLKKHQNKA